MRYSFRLAELIGHEPNPRRRPGTIKAIVDYTGLDRHQVAALLKNEVKYIPLHALSRLCDYLIEHNHATPDQLPGALFAVEPENFWELLARRKRLELCLGVRAAGHDDGAWVVAADSVLLGELLNGVSTLGGTSRHRDSDTHPHPEHLKQSLVWSPGQAEPEKVMSRAQEVFDDFSRTGGDRSLIGLGSMKSNPVVEMILASTFGCDPFVSQDNGAEERERACPFYLRYREEDPHLSSCCAGVALSKSNPTTDPGIYYETANGTWDHCQWEGPNRDAAFLFYVHRESQGCLEMVLGGFSGGATQLLARTLSGEAEEFWPPNYEKHGLQIGAFIVQYTIDTEESVGDDLLKTDLVANTSVIPIATEAIARRLDE